MNEEKSKPKFLIIGSMKCGTTGLFNDLAGHPDIFVPLQDKEPEFFATDKAFEPDHFKDYLKLFSKMCPGQICGEASTAYTKAPDFTGVAARVKKILGPDMKLIFIFRDPIQRIVSHHHHELTKKLVPESIGEAVRTHHRFIDYSKYYFQLTPWIKEFGLGNLHLVDFDKYKTNRLATVREALVHLGLSTDGFELDESKVHNVSKNKPMITGFWKMIYSTSFYQRFVRKLVSQGVRSLVFRWVVPKSPFEKQTPSSETVAFLKEQLHEDQEEFQKLYKSMSNNA